VCVWIFILIKEKGQSQKMRLPFSLLVIAN